MNFFVTSQSSVRPSEISLLCQSWEITSRDAFGVFEGLPMSGWFFPDKRVEVIGGNLNLKYGDRFYELPLTGRVIMEGDWLFDLATNRFAMAFAIEDAAWLLDG